MNLKQKFGLPIVAVTAAVAIALQFASACSEEPGNSSVSGKPVVAITPRLATPDPPMPSPGMPDRHAASCFGQMQEWQTPARVLLLHRSRSTRAS